MLKRKAEKQFLDWLNNAHNKALLVKGARQVGKSYLIEYFANEHFKHVVKFDMVGQARVRQSFLKAESPEDLLLRMTVASDVPMVAGDTVVIVDEVQRCPNVVTFIKYLVQQGDYRFVLSGSLLGVELENIDSLPVGYVYNVDMAPLDFEEFCWANGVSSQVCELAASCLVRKEPLPDYLYERLMGLFHRYLLVGGMPDAVNSFLASSNIDEVRKVHENIHRMYIADITKYAPKELRMLLRDIYRLVPSEVGSKSKRFKLSSLKDVKRFSQVTDHFVWLAAAGVVLPVFNVTAPISPLLASEQRNLFKLFYLDVGMLMSSYPKSVAQGVLDGLSSGFAMNMGAVYENFVAQELHVRGVPLRYFASKKIGELDFLTEDGLGKITAIEVKSGARFRSHAALDNAIQVDDYEIGSAAVLAETNCFSVGKVQYLPVFAAGILGGNE